MLSGPEGGGQDHARRADPRAAARPDRRGVARADRGALAVPGAARRRPRADPAAVPRAAPLGDEGEHPRRRQRAGASRRGEPGAPRGAVPRRVPAVPAPTSSRRCASRWRAARSRSPEARRTATFPARAMFVLACNPCPCGDYHPDSRDHRCTCREVKRREYREQDHRPDRRPDRHHPARRPLARQQREPTTCRSTGPSRGRRSAARVDGGAAAAGASATPGRPWRLNAARRRAGAARALAADRRGGGAPRRPRCTPGGSPAAARCGCTGSRGRSRTSGVDRPGRDEARRGAAAALGRPAAAEQRADDARASRLSGVHRRASGWPGWRSSRIGEPGDPRLPSWSHELGAERVLTEPARQATDRRAGATSPRGSRRPTRPRARAGRGAGIRFVVPVTRSGPPALDDLAHAPHLHERGGVAARACGAGPLRLDAACRARRSPWSGSRSATTYGADVAPGLASDLAGESWTRRLRRGVRHRPGRAPRRPRRRRADGRGAGLRRRPGLPGGPPRPAGPHRRRRAVVSEAPPGCSPTRIRFLARNRLIAALPRGTVVVEAAVRSGALNTANWAAGSDRTVMGCPVRSPVPRPPGCTS